MNHADTRAMIDPSALSPPSGSGPTPPPAPEPVPDVPAPPVFCITDPGVTVVQMAGPGGAWGPLLLTNFEAALEIAGQIGGRVMEWSAAYPSLRAAPKPAPASSIVAPDGRPANSAPQLVTA